MLHLHLYLIIRYCSILLCSDYIYHKLLNVNNSAFFRKIFFMISGILFALLFSNLPDEFRSFSYLILFIFHFFALVLQTTSDHNTIFISLLFSYGICYGFYLIAGLTSGTCIGMIGWLVFDGVYLPISLLQISGCVVMYLLSVSLFRIPRFKQGMPFLKDQHFDSSFCSLTLPMLLLVTLCFNEKFNGENEPEKILILFMAILILLLNLIITCRNQLRQTYIKHLKEREITRLEEELKVCQSALEAVKQENKDLSKLIHRDNKQLASLQLAVEQFLSLSGEDETSKYKGDKILQELKQETTDRQQILSALAAPKSLPTTQVSSVDHLLHYILHRGQTYGISLELSLSGNIHYLLENVITEHDFLTLLADILENALIATKCNGGSNILLHIGIIESIYTIDLWDSGIPFTKETLLKLGKKQYTTHKQEGGSGIGLMSTYELLEKYQASLHIDESLSKECSYTKKLSVLFDAKREYHLYTKREPAELSYLHKRKNLQIFTKV